MLNVMIIPSHILGKVFGVKSTDYIYVRTYVACLTFPSGLLSADVRTRDTYNCTVL